MSKSEPPSPGSRLVEDDSKAIFVPSAESEGKSESPFEFVPLVDTLTRVVVPATRSRT